MFTGYSSALQDNRADCSCVKVHTGLPNLKGLGTMPFPTMHVEVIDSVHMEG